MFTGLLDISNFTFSRGWAKNNKAATGQLDQPETGRGNILVKFTEKSAAFEAAALAGRGNRARTPTKAAQPSGG